MKTYDVVIIGSGLGGLLCGYILSKEGYDICILEKNRQLGGNLQIFVRDKCIFDTGIHYIGGLAEGQNLYQYFRYFELMDKLKLHRLDMDRFDVISFDNDPVEYSYAQGYPNFVENLTEKFPKEREAIQTYADKLQEIVQCFPLYNLRPEIGILPDLEYLRISTKDYLASLTNNYKLQNVLAGSNMLYAGEADKTPMYMHALINNTYIESAWKCVDGGSQIAKYLARSIRNHGGKIINYKEVINFVFEGDDLVAVDMKDGDRIYGKNFISNIHPHNTLDMLEKGRIRKAYYTRVNSLENTNGMFTLHLVMRPNSFPYLNYNHYHHKTEDVWKMAQYDKENWPLGYAMFAPISSKTTHYAEALNVMAYMPFDEVKSWGHTFNTVSQENDRGDDYEAFKIERAERMLDALEHKFPGIRSKIKNYYTSTPLSYRDYIGTKDGGVYGIIKDYKKHLNSFISARTRIPNLFFTGQNLHMHGVLGVTVGAILTCSEFVGHEYLLKKVKGV